MAETDIARKVHKMYLDLYEGQGKEDPPMTVRVDRLEQWYEESRNNSRWAKRLAMVQTCGLAVYFFAHLLGWKL